MSAAAAALEAIPWDERERVVVLSPHLDDAALSCGALLRALDMPRLVVTVFAGYEADAGSQQRAETSLRRAEDVEAMHRLGCQHVHLGLPDALYRRGRSAPLERGAAALWEQPRAEESSMRRAVAALLRQLFVGAGTNVLLAPLGIGGHVDHRICAEAAAKLAHPGETLHYEDVPYALAPRIYGGIPDDSAAAAAERLGRRTSDSLIHPVDVAAKLEICRAYASQVAMLFGSEERMGELLRPEPSGDAACERYWRLEQRPAARPPRAQPATASIARHPRNERTRMRAEILEQPMLLRREAARWERDARAAASQCGEPRPLVLLGRGSSGHACTVAAYLWGLNTGRHPVEFRPWLADRSVPDASWDGAVAWAYSVSGESTDLARAAAWLRQRGASVVAITNASSPGCRLGQAADAFVWLSVGAEEAVPATKSFIAQIAVSAALCGVPIRDDCERGAEFIEAMAREAAQESLVRFIEPARETVLLGRGPGLAAAEDAALKLREASGQNAVSWSAAEFLHGPVGALGADDRVVLLMTEEDDGLWDQVARAATARNAPVLAVGKDAHALPGADALDLDLPGPAWLQVALLSTWCHLAAETLAARRGLDPDRPAGLEKVTPT